MATETTPHDAWRDSAALYALGALSPEERASVEAHLAGCAECAAEIRSMSHVADALAEAVPQHTPPPALRERVLAAAGVAGVAAYPHATAASGSSGGTQQSSTDGADSTTFAWIGLAATIALAAGLGFYASDLRGRIASLESQLQTALAQAAETQAQVTLTRQTMARAQQQLDVLTAPDSARVLLAGQPPAPGATGRADWSRSRGLALSVANLPPPQPMRTYQLWILNAGAPISAGLVTPADAGSGTVFFATPPDVPQPTGFALSEEPEGGVPAPTGAIYLVGLLSQAR